MAVLRVEGLAKSYGQRTIGPVSFSLGEGEVGLILGGSGSGKSTVLDLIYGTRWATAGAAVFTAGAWRRDLIGLSVPELVAVRRRAIGYCTQFLQVIPTKSGYELAQEIATPGIMAAEIEALFDRLALPASIWKRPVFGYSGGEKQRLNIALATIRRPQLILFDEPFASLDRTLHTAVRELLSDLAKGGTSVLIAEHQPARGICSSRALVSLD